MDMVRNMIENINARANEEGGTRVAARMARAEAAHRQQARQDNMTDLITVLTLNAGFLGIIIFMALATA